MSSGLFDPPDFDPFITVDEEDVDAEEPSGKAAFDLFADEDKEAVLAAALERVNNPDDETGGLYKGAHDTVVYDPRLKEEIDPRMRGASKALIQKKERNQQQVLQLIAKGYTQAAAAEAVGISRRTVYNWSRSDTNPGNSREFRRALADARMAAGADINTKNKTDWDFETLRKYCFNIDTYGYQQVIVDIIEQAPEGEITMILLPPGVGKTMTLEDYLSIKIGQDHSTRVLYISESDDLGERTLGLIKRRMGLIAEASSAEEFERYRELFGPFRNPDDPRATVNRVDRIRLHDANVGQRDMTFQARGWDSTIYSMRADIMVFDDIQTLRTLNQTKKMLSMVRKTALTRREGGIEGKVIYIGTRLGLDDLPGTMIREGMIKPECLFVLPLVNTEGVSNFEEVIKTKSVPLIIRQQGSDFQTIYQQNPTAEGGNTFDGAIEPAIDKMRRVCDNLELVDELRETKKLQHMMGMIDPALDGYCAIHAVAVTRSKFYCLELFRDQDMGRTSNILDQLELFVIKYQIDTVIVETKGFQKALYNNEQLEEMQATYGFMSYPHETGDNKNDPIQGVAKMPGTFQAGGVSIPWGDDFSKEMFKPFKQELGLWRPDIPPKQLIQDTVMAFWFGWHWVMARRFVQAKMDKAAKAAREAQRHRRFRTRSGLPWAPTTLRRHRS